jgi:hypothetical protein
MSACTTTAGAHLYEVLVAPWVAELVGLPALVHSQQREVVALRLEELGSLLVSLHTNSSTATDKGDTSTCSADLLVNL